MKLFRYPLLAVFLGSLLSACGSGDYNVPCSAYTGPNLPADYVTGSCADGRFIGYKPSTQQKGTGVCDEGNFVSGELEDGTPFAGSCAAD